MMHDHQDVETYLNPPADQQVDMFLLSAIAQLVIPRLHGPRVLEMGLGHLAWTPRLVEQFPSVTTIERSEQLIRRARKVIAPARWNVVQSNFEEYQPTEPFDTVVATYVLEHVDDPSAILRTIRGWLKPGGEVAIVVPNALSLHRRLAVRMGLIQSATELGSTDHLLEHHHCFTPDRIEKEIVSAGFSVREKQGLLVKSLPNALLTGCTEEQLRGLVHLGLEIPMDLTAALYYRAEAGCLRTTTNLP